MLILKLVGALDPDQKLKIHVECMPWVLIVDADTKPTKIALRTSYSWIA